MTLEKIKWDYLIISSVVWLYGRHSGLDVHLIFPIGNEW
jgi:hypothetical protein